MLSSLTNQVFKRLQAQGVDPFIGFAVSDCRCGIKVDDLVAVLRTPFLSCLVHHIRPFADFLAKDFMKYRLRNGAMKLEGPVKRDRHCIRPL